MTKIHDSFQLAMEKIKYPGGFRDMFQYLYPVKVCFENSVVDAVLQYGEQFGIGIEAGSRGGIRSRGPQSCGKTWADDRPF